MANYFIRNTRNDRLELHFDRDYYLGLTESIKQSVRASFFFNKSIPAWLSKSKLSENSDLAVPDYLDLEDYGTSDGETPESGAVPAERRTYERREPAAPRVELPFEQHLKAYAMLRSLLAETKENNKVETFIDGDGIIYLHHYGLYPRSWQDESERAYEKWVQLAKSGKDSEWTPGKIGYGATEVWQFGTGVYGIKSRKEPEWFVPAHSYGSAKDLSNSKQIEANRKQLIALGLELAKSDNYRSSQIRFKPTAKSGQPKQIVAKTTDALKPFDIPSRLNVPAAKRKPHYDLSARGGVAVRSDLVETELLLGKMEIAEYKHFDSMQDMDVYTSEDNLRWYVPEHGMPYTYYKESPSHVGVNLLRWGPYNLRYRSKPAPAVINLSVPAGSTAKVGATPTATDKPQTAEGKLKRGAAFIKTADSLLAESDKKFSELENAQSNTPKRLKEYNTKRIEADIALDKSVYYRAIGKAIMNDTLPPILSGITPVRAKNDLYLFINGYATGGGYYEAYRAEEPRFIAEQKYSAGGVLKGAAEIGLTTIDDLQQAYDALQEISGRAVKVDLQKQKLTKLVDKWRFSNQPGFFPTPPDLARRLVKEAGIQPGDTILEPSAGLGDLAEIIKEMHPNNTLTVCETMYSLREILELKGFVLDGSDFLDLQTEYDRIIMNPPFENGQDIDHVRHAYYLLKPGGSVVAIMGEGAFNGNQRKSREFLEFLEDVNGEDEKLPIGSFKSAFRPTGVNTRLVSIFKPNNTRGPSSANGQLSNQAQAKAKLKLKMLLLQD